MDEIVFGEVHHNGSDKNRVLALVDNLQNLLQQITQTQECDFMFYQDRISPMKEAWGVVSERFEEIKLNTKEASIDALQNHGLTGSELKYKISVINHAGKQFYFYLTRRVYPLVNRWFKKLLETLDKFLTSLLDAVGGSGAIGEYKSFIESSIDDGVWVY